jgi:hypothetical protein
LEQWQRRRLESGVGQSVHISSIRSSDACCIRGRQHNGINTAHYLMFTNAEVAARGEPMHYHMKENAEFVNTNLAPSGWIYMPTEFMHGLYDGGAGAGLEDYWNMMMSYSNCAGGFIWVLTDEGIKNPHTGQLDTAGNQAPDGIVGPYREREGSFYAIRDIWGTNQIAPQTEVTNVIRPTAGNNFSRRVFIPRQAQRAIIATEEISGGGLLVRIAGQTGMLQSLERHGNKLSLHGGPRLVGTNAELTNVSWELHSNGWLHCDFGYTVTGPQDAFGVVFDYPEELVKKKRWLGDGPFRVWKNRLRGVTFGEWENDYNNTITGHSGWVYPEFKGCLANVRWLQLETTEGLITVVPENIPYVQVLTPEQPPDNLIGKTKVNLPQCGLGFLHAIPPIGTKFKDAASSGPQGQPNVGQGEYSGRVSFYFGKLP